MGDGVLSGRRSGSEVSSLRLGDAFEEKIDTEKERSSNIQNSFSPSETADAEHEAEAEQPSLVDDLPTKARGYLERAERELMDKISAALSIPNRTKEGRTFLQEISRAVSEEFLREGIVSEETVERLFEDAYDRGIVIDDTYYKQYKDIKEHLRRTALTISDTDKADIPDYGQWKKQAFGTLRIIKKGGLPVDTAYEELRGMAPELFPEELTHPADQLMKMYEVGKSIEKAEYSLDQAYGAGAADFKTYRRNDFGAAIDDLAGELRQVRRYADERQAEREMAEAERNAPEPTMDEIMRTYRALKAARKVQERALTKHLLTEHDQVQVGRLLRGELELEHLDPAKDNVAGIRAVYEAKAEYEKYAKQISAWNRHRKALLREQADSFLETANDWNDKKMGILYSRETMERNIRDIVPNEELAEQIIATYFAPVHKAQAEATRMKNTYRARVAALNLSRDVAEGNNVSEAHAVQLLGEAEDNIRMMEQSRGRMKMRDGRTLTDWQGVVQDLWANNPNLDERKIREAVSEFRRIYDELFSAMNESRVRNGYEPVNYRSGYFPHFQPGDDAGILQIFGRALGIEMGVSALPTTINGLTHTFRPGIQWFGNAQERLGYNTAYDAVEGFDRYIEGVADVVHQTDNIQRLRALASQIRYRTSDAGIQEQVDAIKNNKELADRDKENRIKELYESGRFTLSRFVDELDEYTNLLANKKSKGDRAMESALGREMYTFMKGLESRVAANMVAVNPGSWLTNFIPLVQGWGMLDTDTLLRGMWGTLQAYKADDGIVGRSTFLTNRRGSDPLVQTWQQKTSAKLSTPMEYIDNFTADSLVRARYYQNLKRGISEDAALEEADAWTAGVMADRSKGSMPTLFSRSNPLIKPFTQFQLEVNNQLGYIFKDMVPEQRKLGKKALAKALIKFALGAWLYNEIYEYFIGRRPALDPIGILIDAVEDGFGKDFPEISDLLTGDFHTEDVEKKKPYEVINGVAEEVAGQLPFMTGLTLMGIESDVGRLPVSSAIPNFENLNKALTNTDWADGKRWAVGVKEVAKPLTYLAFPFGGGQVKKIWQGVAAMVKGGSYTKDEDGNDILQYPVYNDTPKQIALNTAGALLFGKTALSTGRDWVESGFKNMGVKDTACYQALLDFGVEGETAFDLLQELRGAEKTEEEESVATNKRKILYEAEVPKEAKAIIYRTTMTDSDKEIALLDLFVEEEWDVGTAGEVLLLMKDEKKAVAKRTAIIESALTDEEKKTVFRYMMGDRQEDGTYASGRDADIEAFERAGLDIDQFLRIYNRYAEIEDAYDDNRATIFAKWLDDQGFSTRQEELAKETFKYFNFTPDTAKRYEDFTGYGIESDDAYALDGSLDALTGKELSSSELKLEKYQTIVDSDLAESDQLAAFWTVAGTDAERRRLQTIEAFDVSLESFVAAKKKLAEGAADGEQKQPEVTEIIRSMTGLSNAEKAVLWQLLGSGWSYKNNPFSTSVGKRVLEMIEALKEAPEMLSLPSPDDDAPVQVVPPLSLARP